MDSAFLTVAGGSLLVIAVLATLLIRSTSKHTAISNALEAIRAERANLQQRLKPLGDVEQAAFEFKLKWESEKSSLDQQMVHQKAEIERLRSQYSGGFQRFQQLEGEVRGLEEHLEAIDAGLYRPHFTYADSDAYKSAIEYVRERQKAIIKAGTAATCGTTWTVAGSQRDGERMVKQYQKTILRAFNAESEAAIANVTWSNYEVMKNRVRKAFDSLNKLGTTMQITLTEEYCDTRLLELQLVFEAAEKRQQEREEQRRLRAEQREEEKAQRELTRAREEAEKDEAKYQKALDKVRGEMERALESEHAAMQARIQELEADLAEAHNRKERAKAQAELTKIGHVYIISNLGAFGDGVVKIGLTRRLEPEERIQELGDASVPFPFDLHALIYSENAPALEAELHDRFWDKRLNWANDRKEFFRVAPLEINTALLEMGLKANFTSLPEAREYRETLAVIEQVRKSTTAVDGRTPSTRLPSDPFEGVYSEIQRPPAVGAPEVAS